MEYNFTPVPNWFWKIAPELSNTELRIMLLVYSQTVAYESAPGRRQVTNTLSYTFIQQEAGISSRTAIKAALDGLEARKLITRSTKRVTGQAITVFPKNPILPIELVINSDSLVINSDSQSHEIRLSESTNQTHIKKLPKNISQETTTGEKFTDSQQVCVNMLLLAGIDSDTVNRLIRLVWERGQDERYIQDVLGYVANQKAKSPPAYIRRLVERNSDLKPLSNVTQASQVARAGLDIAKYAHGGTSHKFANDTCQECHPELERLEG